MIQDYYEQVRYLRLRTLFKLYFKTEVMQKIELHKKSSSWTAVLSC